MQEFGRKKSNGTLTTRVVCAVVFVVFSFFWVYFFQPDVLAVSQHVLSGGQTHYDRTIGAVIITLVLWFLQLGVYRIVHLARRTHALTYLPSMLLLAFVSDVPSDVAQGYSMGNWTWAGPLTLVVWAGVVWLARHLLPFEKDDKEPTGIFSHRTWLNVLQLVAMMIGVAALANTNAAFHFRCHAETALLQGDTEEAVRVGRRSNETDVSLTMLRFHALAREGRLADELFLYDVEGTSKDLLPLANSRFELLLLPEDSLWHAFGARPGHEMSTAYYLRTLMNDTTAHPMVADYVLCGYLLDRNLEGFARALPHFYPDTVALPRFYGEALSLRGQRGPTKEQAAEESPGSYAFYYFKGN